MTEIECTEVDFDVLEAETANAYLFVTDPNSEDEHRVWVPKSLVRSVNVEECHFTVPVWFAEKEGLV